MEIKKASKKHTVLFSDVREGGTFRYFDSIYIKLPDIFPLEVLETEFNSYDCFDSLIEDYDYNNCYSLTGDCLSSFTKDTEVELITCELTVYD